MAEKQQQTLLFINGDSIQREKAVLDIHKRRFGGADAERMVFKADEGQIARAVEEVYSFSLFSENKIVILKNVDAAFKSKGKGAGKAANDELDESKQDKLAPLLECVEHPRGDTPFLLFAEKKGDIPKTLLAALGKPGVVALQKTPEGEIKKAIVRKCEAAKVKMHPSAIAFLVEQCNKDADSVQHEMEKILLWAEAGQTISLEDIQPLLHSEKDEVIWEITNAVVDQKPPRALKMLDRLIEQGEDPIGILALIASSFRKLHQCKAVLQDQIPKAQWAELTKIKNNWALEKTVKSSKSFSLEAFRRSAELLRQADIDLKGGKSNGRLVIERLVVDLCRLQESQPH